MLHNPGTETHLLSIGGEERTGELGFFESLDPSSTGVVAQVAFAGSGDVDSAVATAQASFDDGVWRLADPEERAATLRRAAGLIRDRRQLIAEAETRDTGKPLRVSLGDVDKTAAYVDFYSSLPQLPIGKTLPAHGGWHTWTRRVPYGVVAAIAPWNFAFRMAVLKTIPALAAGNSVILKSSELAPVAGTLLADVLATAGLPLGVLSVLHGDGATTGAALASHPGVNKITFTGSVMTGRTIAQTAAANLTSCHLELGGKAPTLIFDDADLEVAANFTFQSALVNSGQICTAPTRLLVQRSAIGAFVHALTERIGGLRWGDPMAEDTTFGPLISQAQLDRVAGYRSRALEAGATEVSPLAAESEPTPGFWMRPSILEGVTPDHEIFRNEVFGPLITVTGFDTDEDGIQLAGGVEYALSANVFTTSLQRRRLALDGLRVGTVWINSNTYRPVHTPFEGNLASGYGVDGGTDVMDSFTRLETIIEYGLDR